MRSGFLLTLVAVIAACADTPSAPRSADADADRVGVQATDASDMAAREATSVQFGRFALHVPKNVNKVQGVLVALGGPNTQGFAIGGIRFGPPDPAVEASLQTLGDMFRELAVQRGLAILGTSYAGPMALPDGPASDAIILDGIAEAAAITGRADLVDAPILMYGMSGGAPEAAGFTRRNPERVSALALKVPGPFAPMSGAALDIPGLMVLAELDAFVDNTVLTATFEAQRAAGGAWANALEPGVVHHSLSPAQRDFTVAWMKAILPFQRTQGAGRPAHAGWLGDPATGEIAPSATYAGDRDVASWFPTRPLAEQWAAFVGF